MKTTKQWANYLLNEGVEEKEEKIETEVEEKEEVEVDAKKVEKAYDKLLKIVGKLDEDQAKKFDGVIADIKKALGIEDEKEEEEEEKEKI